MATSTWLPQHRPLLLACLRVVPAAVVLLAVARPRCGWPLARRALATGVVQFGLFFACFFAATDRLPNAVAAVVTNTAPLWVLGLAPLVLHERSPGRRWAAAAAGVLGVALLVGASSQALSASGVAFGLAAALALAVGLVATRRWLGALRPLDSAALQLAAGGALLVLLALTLERRAVPVDARLVAGTTYLSLVLTTVPYVLLMRGIARLGPERVALLGPITPVVAVGLAWVTGRHGLAPLQLLGLVVVLGALVTSQVGRGGAEPQVAQGRT